MQPPQVRIVRGSPTPDEEEAVREAVTLLWRDDLAAAQRNAARDPWVVAARVESTRRGAEALPRGTAGWRLSGRVAAAPLSDIRHGRGDAK